MVEALCETVDPHPGQRILDVACGNRRCRWSRSDEARNLITECKGVINMYIQRSYEMGHWSNSRIS